MEQSHETTAIEYTDRYGGHGPSWLRGCFGRCEAMGFYPVYIPVYDDRAGTCGYVYPSDTRPLSRAERRQVTERAGEDDPPTDGWFFLECPACHGSGRVSWFTTLARVPRWLVRGVRILWNTRPGNDVWLGHPFGWRQRLWIAVKVAFLCDLGVRP